MSSIICRISGLVAFSDGSSEPFESTLNANGLVAVVSQIASEDAIAQDHNSSNYLSQMLALLANNIPSLGGLLYQAAKTPVSMWSQITGRIARDNGTWADFIAQYSPQLGAFVPAGGDIAVWKEITDDAGNKALVDTMFKAINNNVTAF